MGTRDIPQADMLKVQKGANAQRRELFKFTPDIGLKCINSRELIDLDYFYLDTQKYRDYYRDAYNHMHKPERFSGCIGSGGYKKDNVLIALTAPIYRVREPQPVVYSIHERPPMDGSGSINIVAHYAGKSSVNYKR